MYAVALLLLLLSSALAQANEVIVAASNDTPALRSFVAELATRRPGDQVRLARPDQLGRPSSLPAGSRLVLLGAEALDWRLADERGPPTLVMQISRVEAHKRLSGRRPARLTLLWNDPEPERQLRLIRELLPQVRRVGVLYSNDSRFLLDELTQAAAAQNLIVTSGSWPDTRDSRPLNRLLDTSDVLLGIDDPALYNPSTIKSVLLASYGRRLALIGPTAAFIRAGSLSSSYSDQHDWLGELDRLLAQKPASWPAEAYPQRFKVLSNAQVARSLGVELHNDHDLTLRLQQQENTP